MSYIAELLFYNISPHLFWILIQVPTFISSILDTITYTTVLHTAAKYNNLELWTMLSKSPVLQLLKNGKDIRGTTPLIAAAWYDNIIAVNFLLNAHVDVITTIYDTKKTALHISADLPHTKICEAILKYNNATIFLEMMDSDGNTATMVAMLTNSPCVLLLLSYGANYASQNNVTGRNILHMAVAVRNHSMVNYLVTEYPTFDFLNCIDINGCTPLHLAIQLKDLESIEPFLQTSFVTELISEIKYILPELIKTNQWQIMEKILKYGARKSFLNLFDEEGQTLLIYAVRLMRIQIVKVLLNYKLDIKAKNILTGENILHTTAYAHNDSLTLLLLNIPGIGDLFNEADFNGLTPFEIILGNGNFQTWSIFMGSGFIDYTYLNSRSETLLFIAAKKGNYQLVRSILLSEPCRYYLQSDDYLSEEEIYKLEMQHNIYTSDLYAIFGAEIPNRVWIKSPAQEFLFKSNDRRQNIFHACALGQSLECLKFIYKYCLLFNNQLKDFDAPDNYGNTPLLFATLNNSTNIAKFFIVNGANLVHRNIFNESPLEIIYTNIHEFHEMISDCINECVVTDIVQNKDPKKYMKITYNILCPPGYPQMDILSELFRKFRETNNNREIYLTILKNPVIEYFVLYKWEKIKKIVGKRIIFSISMVMVYSMYLTCRLCMFLYANETLIYFYWWIIFLLSSVIVLFSIPVLFMKKIFSFLITFISSICTLIYLLMNSNDRLALEMAAVSILLSWFSVIIQGYISNMSFQVAMFNQVVRSVFFQLPICILILFAFSNCFFTLFHDYFSFNNPIRSFIVSAVFFVERGLSFPTLEESNSKTLDNNDMYAALDEENENIIGKREMWNMVVEGSLLLLFKVLVCVCLLGMLIRLAVHEGEELELQGEIHRIHMYVDEINAWEHFVESKFYKIINKLHIYWLFGVPKNMKENLKAPLVLHPLIEKPLPNFQMFELKYIATDIQLRKPKPLPSLLHMIRNQEIVNPLRRGSKANQSIKWI